MTVRDERPAGVVPPALPDAIELLAAMSQTGLGRAGEGSGFYWATVQRVMAGRDSVEDLAGLVFAQTALSHLLLRHLAEVAGTTPGTVLGELAAAYTYD